MIGNLERMSFFVVRNVARNRIQFYFWQQSQQLASAVAQFNQFTIPPLHSQCNFPWAHASFCVDRPPPTPACDLPQAFSAQIVASCSDHVAWCDTSFLRLRQKHFFFYVPLPVLKKINWKLHLHNNRFKLTLSLLRVINVKIPLQPHKKYDITQYGELDFS